MADKYNGSRNATRHARIAAGLCRDCGKLPPTAGRATCNDCFAKRVTQNVEYRNARKSEKRCTQCVNPAKATSTLCTACSGRVVIAAQLRRKHNKEYVYAAFDKKCAECGENDIRVMTIDHVNNDGRIDVVMANGNRASSTALYTKLVATIKNNTIDWQRYKMLCFNCHAKKDNSPWWCNDTSG